MSETHVNAQIYNKRTAQRKTNTVKRTYTLPYTDVLFTA